MGHPPPSTRHLEYVSPPVLFSEFVLIFLNFILNLPLRSRVLPAFSGFWIVCRYTKT